MFLPKFALAAELISTSLDHDAAADADQWDMEYSQSGVNDAETVSVRSPMYEPDFTLFDRSIIGRAPAGVTGLSNNVPENTNLEPGTTARFVFEVSSLSGRDRDDTSHAELRRRANDSEGEDELEIEGETTSETALARRQSTKTLWISATTCIQPEGLSPNKTWIDPPQLTLYVSTDSKNTAPGPKAPPESQLWVVFQEGAVMYNTTLSGDVYFSVTAPNVSEAFASRLFNVDVAASIDQSYHSFDVTSDPDLLWVDSDSSTSLFTTRNLTDSPDKVVETPPYSMFAYAEGDTSVIGVRQSICGLKQYAQIGGSKSTFPSNMIRVGLSNKSSGGLTKQQIYLRGLNSSTNYVGILAKSPNNSLGKRENTAGGGGTVFRQVEFDTKSNGTCTFIFNLTFCSETAYAVPGNPAKFADATELGKFYDDYAAEVFDGFNKSMQQIACETENSAMYSLARNCDDCRDAYKTWLCSVTIPRCEDFSKTADYLQMRNINQPFLDGTTVPSNITDQYGQSRAFNQSRVLRIDEQIQPGPYKEVLPCDELCYDIVQSCPAELGFSCPTPGMLGFNTSYGTKQNDADANITCNYPGASHVASQANVNELGLVPVVAAISITFLLLYSR